MSASASWDAALYAQHTAHHRAYDDHILGPVAVMPRFAVLDVGSGAGDLTAKLAALVPDGSVLGVDASLPLVEEARARFKGADNVAFQQLRAQQLGELNATQLPDGRRSGPPFDLVITVATLHWVPGPDHPDVYRSIFNLLGAGGTFRADFGGEGQIYEVRTVLNAIASELGGEADPWYFPSATEVQERLLTAGFSVDGGFVRLITQRRSVPDVDAFVGWLDSQVLIAYQPSLPGGTYEEFRRLALDQLIEAGPREDGTFDQDYIRVDAMVTKPG